MPNFLEILLKAVMFLVLALTGFAYMTWIERRVIARMQSRIGPNRVGPQGLLQPVAEGLKLIFKESITPAQADRFVYFLAPMLAVIPAIALFAVIPISNNAFFNLAGGLDTAVLYVLAMLGTAVYGIALAGWSSNNKYASIGGLRARGALGPVMTRAARDEEIAAEDGPDASRLRRLGELDGAEEVAIVGQRNGLCALRLRLGDEILEVD